MDLGGHKTWELWVCGLASEKKSDYLCLNCSSFNRCLMSTNRTQYEPLSAFIVV